MPQQTDDLNNLPMTRFGPWVKGRCPACKTSSLFVGAGGYLTCGNLPCPNPSLVTDLLAEDTGEAKQEYRVALMQDGQVLVALNSTHTRPETAQAVVEDYQREDGREWLVVDRHVVSTRWSPTGG